MVIEGTRVQRGVTWEKYVAVMGQGDIMCRRDVAHLMGVHYNTATYHLERAVSNGALNKQHGFTINNQPGWVYALPSTMPRLKGI